MIWFSIFWEFFKTGLFSVGGGLATLPFFYDISQRTHWFTSEDIANMVAISESTPGPLGVNMATYVGYQMEGIWGGIYTTLSLTLPSVIVIIIIFSILSKFRESKAVKRIFYGLRPASTALIAAAGLGVAKITFLTDEALSGSSFLSWINWESLILAVILYAAIVKWHKHPVFYIACSAAVGILLQL